MKEQENKQNLPSAPQGENGEKRPAKKWILRLRAAIPSILACLGLTLLLLIVYELAIRALWMPMYWIYYAALALSGAGYVLYNRGFSRDRVSRNELPHTWSETEKDEFFADAERRKKRSRPLLILAISLLLVFLYDTVEIFFGDFLSYYIPFLEFLG